MNALDTLFHWFVFATVRGTLLALAVLALQAALRGRLPACWHFALWLPVMFALAAPWLPQSRWSAENRFAQAAHRIEQGPLAITADDRPLLSEPPAVSPESAPVRQSDWRRIAQVGWLAGAAGMLVLALAAYGRTVRRMRRQALPADAELSVMIAEALRTSGLRRAPRVLVSAAVQSPAVTGFWRPLLLLPAGFPGAFTRGEARLVLLHELAHLQRWDLPLNWLLGLLQALHWCNPVLWFVFGRMRADREAACDARVLALAGADSRAAYGHALLKLEGSLPRPSFTLGFVGIFERAAGLRARVRAIAAHRRAHPAWGVLGAGLIAALTAVGATRAQSPHPAAAVAANLEPRADADAASARLPQKLNDIVIPRLDFREATLSEALDYLRLKSVQLDAAEPDVAKRGVNIILNLTAPLDPAVAPPTTPANPTDARITVALTNIPLIQALRYVTGLANLKFRITANAVEVVPLNALTPLSRREWKISAAMPNLGANPQAALAAAGVPFPTGATVGRSADGTRLIMLNSAENLDVADTLLTAPRAQETEGIDPRKKITDKLRTIIIPRIEFSEATIREAVDFLKKKSVELDTAEPDVAKRGVNFVLKLGEAPVAPVQIPGLEAAPTAARPLSEAPEPRLTVELRNIPLLEALRYVTGLGNMKFRVEPYSVAIVPNTPPTGVLITKEYKVNEHTIEALGFTGSSNTKTILAAKGITFPDGAAATWLPLPKRLVIRNTQENLGAVQRLLEADR